MAMDNEKTTINLEISTLNYQKLQYFALQQGLTVAKAVDQIFTVYLEPRNSDRPNNPEAEIEIEDEPDEILWDFLEE